MKISFDEAKYWQQNARELQKSANKHIKNTIIQNTKFLPDNAPLQQRLWHIINETTEIPRCKSCSNTVSWDVRFKRYKTFCGNKRCYTSDPMVIAKKLKNTDIEEIHNKRKQTCLTKYGHTNFLASDAGKEQIRQKFQEQTPEQKNQRYNKVKKTREQTVLEKYGVSNFSSLKLTENARNKLDDEKWLKEQHHTLKQSQTKIAEDLKVRSGATLVGRKLRLHNIEIRNPTPRSTGEQQIVDFLNQHDVKTVLNSKSIISPYELDIYIPEHKLAIEYCGLYWHAEQQGKGRQYHKKKYDLCREQGIQLLTIYEDEWFQRQDQVEQKILSLLRKDTRPVVYARNTQIVNVTTKTKRSFFNKNHIQGNGPGSINIGLLHDNELVACMSFIKQKNQHYLNRYATSCRVVGGFSKLLKYFQRNYSWTEIISFADLRWSDGNLYKTTGWELDKTLDPDYYYSPNGHDRFHKFNYRRKNLPKLLEHFDPNLSEKENCNTNGVLRIWDCGKLRFIIKKER